MKKLAGLLAFAVALACAIVLTKYYSPSQKQVEPPPAPPAVATPPAAPASGAGAHVVFKPGQITLDLAAKKASVGLTLESDPASPAPERVWVWAYFFTQDAPGRYCEGGPVEVKKPFATGSRVNVTPEFAVSGCPEPRTASTTFYARVNVSSESAFAARLTQQRISYDISQATPVVLQGTRK